MLPASRIKGKEGFSNLSADVLAPLQNNLTPAVIVSPCVMALEPTKMWEKSGHRRQT